MDRGQNLAPLLKRYPLSYTLLLLTIFFITTAGKSAARDELSDTEYR
ncbi:hypothetical protein GCM10027018_20050 [Paenibacillus thermoaerophilus]